MREVNVKLSPAQVVQVCADAGRLVGSDPLLDQFANEGGAAEHKLLIETDDLPITAMSRSFIRGLEVLSLLPRDGSGVGVIRIAEKLGITRSTAHRYLTTLVAVGLARRDERTRVYSRPLGRAE